MSDKAVGGCILLLLFVCCPSPTRACDSSCVSDLPIVRALDPPYVAVAGGNRVLAYAADVVDGVAVVASVQRPVHEVGHVTHGHRLRRARRPRVVSNLHRSSLVS